MQPETGRLESCPCILVDVDAFGKLQLYNANIKKFKLMPLEETLAAVKAGAVRAIVAPNDLEGLFRAVGWHKADVLVGQHLAPDIGNGDADEL